MAGVNEKISVVVDILGDISNFQNSIKGMQGELNKLNLSSGIKNSFSSIFTELEREINKIQTLGSKKKIDLIDSRALNKSFANVEALYSKLVNKMQSAGIKNSIFEKDAVAISKVESQLKSYESSIKKISSSWSAAKGQVTRYTNEFNKLKTQKDTGVITIISEEEYQRAKAQIDALEDQKKQAQARSKQAVKSGDIEAENEAIKEQLQLTTQLEEAHAALDGKMTQKQYDAELDRINNKLTEAIAKVEAFQQANSTEKAAAWKDLVAEISKIDGINWDKLNIDPSKIKNVNELKEAIAQMKLAAASEAVPAIEKLENAVHNMGGSLDEGARKAEQTAQALMDLGDRQRDIQQLASRLTHFFSLTNQFMIMRRIIQNAITTIKELDKAMTETAVVTKFDVSDMWAQLPEYTKVANELGATTKGAYETMTLFYQQGLDQQQAFQLGTETMKMARIAGLDYAEATDRMTNALRGFNMELNDVSSQRVNDVYSNLAAKSASNVDELSTAMTKTASIAHAANMEFETTAAFLAQIIETTRESAETAGTALKTVIARFSEVKKLYSEGELTGQDEEGEEINVNRVSTALRAAGVDLNEYLVGAKGLDEVFIELASKWDNLDLVTQRYIATMAAGSRQQSRFIALMQDYERQTELVGYAQNAAGASTEQFNKTLDSLEAKLNKLENAWNEFTMGIANSSLIKGAIDLITGLITAINKITGALGPVGGAITKVLLLFAGFKGVRVLFDKFIGHIATVYIDVARKAGVAGMGAGEKYSKGFLTSIKASFGKFKKVFQDTVSVKINSSQISSSTKALTEYNAALQNNIKTELAANQSKLAGFEAEKNRIALTEAATTATINSEAAEKAKQALDALGITQENVRNGILSGKINIVEMLNKAESEEALTQMIQNAASKQNIILEEGEAEAAAKAAFAKKLETASEASLIKKLAAGILVLFGHKSAADAMAAANITDAMATDELTASLERLQAAAPWIWAIVAAIAAIAIAIHVAEQTSLDGKINDIANLSADLDNRLAAIQDRLDSFDEHTSAIDSLQQEIAETITGTQEWKTKVQELNQEYFELAELLGADFWKHIRIEQGQIIPEEGYLEKAQQQILDEQINLQQQKLDTSIMSNDLKMQKRQESLFNMGNIHDFRTITKYDENGAPIIPEQPDFIKKAQQLSIEERANLINAASMEELNGLTEQLFNGWHFVTENLQEAKNELTNFFADIDSLTAEMDASAQMAASNLTDKTINADAYVEVIKGAKDSYLSTIEEVGGEVDSWIFNIGATFTDNKINEVNKKLKLGGRKIENMTDAFQEYVDIMNRAEGPYTYQVSSNGLDIEKKNGEGQYEKWEVDPSQVVQTVLEDWVNDVDYEQLYKDAINSISESIGMGSDEAKESLERIIGGTYNLEDIRNKDAEFFKDLQQQLKDKNLNITLDPILTEEGWKGFERELQENIDKKGLNINASSISGLTKQGQDDFLGLFGTKITGSQDSFINTLLELKKSTDNENFSGLLEVLSRSDFDFGDISDWEELPELLKDAGIAVPDSELQTFISDCETLANSVRKIDLLSIVDQTNSLFALLGKVERGDIDSQNIKEEDYRALIESKAVTEDQFGYDATNERYIYLEGQDSLEIAIRENTAALKNDADALYDKNIEFAELADNTGNTEKLKSLLGSEDALDRKIGISRLVSLAQNKGFNLSGLQVEGLANNTQAFSLDQATTDRISQEITTILINGAEGAAQNKAEYDTKFDTTAAYDRGNQYGFSTEMDSKAIAMAAAETENFDAQLIQTHKDYAKLEGLLSEDGWKKLTVDLADADKKGKKLAETFEKNYEALKDINSADYQTAFKELNSAMGDIFGKDVFDEGGEFLKENIDDILEYAETGSEETAEKIEQNIAARQLMIGLGLDAEPAMEAATEIANEIDGWEAEIDVTGYADVTDIINKFATTQEEIDAVARSIESMGDLEVQADVKMSSARLKITNLGKLNSAITDNVGGEAAAAALAKLNGANGATIEYPEMSYKVVKGKGSKLGNLRKGGGSGGGGGGGGGGSNKEPEDNRDWKNPYDKLYNAYAKLEELQRKRNNLEKEFALTVDTAAGSVAKTTQQFKEQLKNLQAQADTQEKIVSGKKSQIANAQNKTYSVEDHVVKSYATAFKDAIDESNKAHGTSFSSNLADYAKYNTSTGQMEIDWNQIQSLEGQIDSAAGEVLEAYVSELEGLEDQLEEAQDGLIDIKTEIKTLVDQAMEDRIAYVDAMREAMISQYQKQIDKLSALNDAINESNSRIFDSLQQQIDLERQIRDNTKTEDEIAKNEARLAYLQRDTSGANDLEIQKLQQTLTDQRENYSDTLVDQELARLQDQADKAQEQREHQISLMEDQLQFWQDTGYFEELIDKGISEGKAMEIYKDYTDYANKTRAEQAKIMQDFYGLFNKGGSANTTALAAADAQYNGGKYKVKDSKGKTYDVSYDAATGTWKGKDINGKAFSLTAEQITSADTSKKILSTSVNLSNSAATSGSGGGGGGGAPGKTENTSTSATNTPSYPYGKASDTSGNIKKGAKGNAVKAIQYALNKLGYGNSGTKSVDGVFGSGTANAVKAFQKAMGISADGIVGKNTRAKFKAKGYSTGGLADYTGPAWLHGSPSKPELVLNAKDTENFIQLKNILADVAKDSKSGSSGGDNYFDIKVEVGEIGSDYDVEKMITKIKDEIDQDARYRNVNSINFIR